MKKILICTEKSENSAILTRVFGSIINSAGGHPSMSVEAGSYQNRFNYDLVHINRPLKKYDVRNGPPIFSTVHDDFSSFYINEESIETLKSNLNASLAISCHNSLQSKQLASMGFKHDFQIPHGYDEMCLKMRDIDNREKNIFTILMCSRYYGNNVKGEHYAFRLLKQLEIPFRVILAGQDKSFFADFCLSQGINVIVYPQVRYKTLLYMYTFADALLVSSEFEGVAAQINESLACGLPVFSRNVGSACDLIIEKHYGILLSGDPSIDAKKISDWAKSCNKKRINAANNLISWSKVGEMYVDAYAKLMNIVESVR